MRVLLSTFSAAALTSLASAQITPYSQDFEGLDQSSPTALGDDGWLVFGNVFDDMGVYQYGYGAFPAPNGSGGFCEIATGQGGPGQGAQQLEVYTDYINPDMGNMDWVIEGNTYREWTVAADDVGKTFIFSFDAKRGDIQPPSDAYAFIKLINTTTFHVDEFELFFTASIPTTWATYQIPYTVQDADVGDLFQIGFAGQAANFDPAGIFYDNVDLAEDNPAGPGSNYCISTTTSLGSASTISATGSSSIAANDLVLSADNLPAQPGIFIAGPTQVQLPFFNGFLCISPSGLQRFLQVNVPSSGVITQAVDYATSASSLGFPGPLLVVAGQTYNYQRWNRDPAAGGGAANFSDGYEILHTP